MIAQKIFQNKIQNKTALKNLIYTNFLYFGNQKAKKLADKIKKLGFEFGTKSGLSLNIEDLKILPGKTPEILKTKKKLTLIDEKFSKGSLTFVERLQQIINTWNTTSENLKNALIEYFELSDPFNSINIMAFSGARGNISQVRQLVGMRGLMATPSGDLIDVPIIHNFREGLSITDYLMSSYGARKGVVDTALRTADSGYLTRRLVEVAHDFIIRDFDCLTNKSIKIFVNEKTVKKIIGRCLAKDLYCEFNKKIILKKGEILTYKILTSLNLNKINVIYVYSPLLCESSRSICQKCYGWDLSKCQKISLGATIGIIAAQSIGEPGTQLTMRTFHTGGIFLSDVSNQLKSKYTGIIRFPQHLNTISKQLSDGKLVNVIQDNTEFSIINLKNITVNLLIPAHSYIFFKKNQFIKKNLVIAESINPFIQTKKIIKNLVTLDSGELYYNNNTKILELLKGDINIIQNNLFLDLYKIQSKYFCPEKNLKQINLLKTTSSVKFSGFINFNLIEKNINSYKIETNFLFKNASNFYLQKDNEKIKTLFLKNSPFSYEKFFIKQNLHSSIITFNVFDFKYYIPFTSELAFINLKNDSKKNLNLNDYLFYKNNVGILLPYSFNREKIFEFKKFYTHVINEYKLLYNTELNTKLKPKIVNNISKKLIYKIKTKLLKKKRNLRNIKIYIVKKKNFSKKKIIIITKEINTFGNVLIKFKGTTLFKKIKIKQLSLCEIWFTNNHLIYVITKLKLFNINKEYLLNTKINSLLTTKPELYFSKKSHNTSTFLEKNEFLLIKKITIQPHFKMLLKFAIFNCKNKFTFNNKSLLFLNASKIEKLPKILNSSNKEIINYINLIKPYLFSYSNIKNTYININNQISIKTILDIKKKQLLNLNFNYCKKYYNEFPIPRKYKKNLNTNSKIIGTFTLLKFNPFKLVIRQTIFYKITPDTTLFRKKGFITKNTILANIIYEKLITGDIIQGLPKIEEILEAKQPLNCAILSEHNGIITNFSKKIQKSKVKYELSIITSCGKIKKLLLNSKINVKKYEFIHIGKRLNEGNTNLNNLLNIYYQHFQGFLTKLEATQLAFIYIQFLITKKIQQIFENQNIFISDKHVELIVKKITSKVKLEDNFISLYFNESIVDIQDIRYINKILKNNKKLIINYNPIILGITKVSLMNKSFLAAASFQETQKTLRISAIKNCIDWMTEIKSNILMGKTQNFGSIRAK